MQQTEYTPVWYMRQAGRYLPEYRKLKQKYTILDICKTPELAMQVAKQPVEILGVDAAILFADIMIPLLGIGVDLEIVENIGPVIAKPIQSDLQVKNLRELDPFVDISYLFETITLLKKELSVPLIGFSAAPFTLASYLIEGRPTRDFMKTKSFMYNSPITYHKLMGKLTDLIIVYVSAQIKTGVSSIQLFDSWAGCLSAYDYETFVYPYSKKIFSTLSCNFSVPLIHFGTNTAGFISSFSSVDCQVIGIDWRIPLHEARVKINPKMAIQGNLDPCVLLSDFSHVKKQVDVLFEQMGKTRRGYIFNLGHGVLPQTPVDILKKLTEYVHKK